MQHVAEGSLEVKLPTIWTDGKAQPGRTSEERRSEREKVRREKVREEKARREKKMQVREKVGQVAKHFVLPMFCARRCGAKHM